MTDPEQEHANYNLELIRRLSLENKNLSESNKFRAEQIEQLEDEISNLKADLKRADYNILTVGSDLIRVEEKP